MLIDIRSLLIQKLDLEFEQAKEAKDLKRIIILDDRLTRIKHNLGFKDRTHNGKVCKS